VSDVRADESHRLGPRRDDRSRRGGDEAIRQAFVSATIFSGVINGGGHGALVTELFTLAVAPRKRRVPRYSLSVSPARRFNSSSCSGIT
jgi:hypothetical protein